MIYITGHRNPDTDSICSAIAYADLKKQMGVENAVACRLGELSNETQFVLDYFGMDAPYLLEDIKMRVTDLRLYHPEALREDMPMKTAWDILSTSSGARLIPVTGEDGRINGLIGMGDLTGVFFEDREEPVVKGNEILIENLLGVLGGEKVYGEYPYRQVTGSFLIASGNLDPAALTDRDIVMTVQQNRAEQFARDSECGCLILADGLELPDCEIRCKSIVRVRHGLLKVCNMIAQAISIRSIMHTDDLTAFSTESYIEDIIELIKTSTHRNFPVIDREGRYAGILSRRHLIEHNRRKIILVDHNELRQSVEGLEQAEILEIIDHHRVADIQTSEPLHIRAEPVGSTATIIYRMYRENGRTPPPNISGLLLAAVLSDTLMFNSPTSTVEDKLAASALATLADLDMQEFGRQMFAAGASLEGLSASEILNIDCKPFTFGRHTTLISQVNTISSDSLPCTRDELLEAMEQFARERNVMLCIFMITDIIGAGSEILFCGKSRQLAVTAFRAGPNDYSITLDGVVSRKKQVVPKLQLASQGI